MTYNVHRCVGVDGRDSFDAIVSVCRHARPDVLALQELDAPETDEADGAHHARDLAAALGMKLLFCRTFRRGVGFYGHALLSRHPIELKKATTFAVPAASHVARRRAIAWLLARRGVRRLPSVEPRGAIWATVAVEGRTVQVVSTHFGLYRAERRRQSIELVGPQWLASPEFQGPAIVCGDLNALPHGATYRRLAARLRDAQRAAPDGHPQPTYPSFRPLVRLDHVFVSAEVKVAAVRVPRDAHARRASDHLPLVVDVDLP